MTDLTGHGTPTAVVHLLLDSIAEREKAARDCVTRHEAAVAHEEREYQLVRAALATQTQQEIDAQRSELTAWQSEIEAHFDTEIFTLRSEYEGRVRVAQHEYENATEAVLRSRKDSDWLVSSVLDENAEGSPPNKLQSFKTQVANHETQLVAPWEALEQAQVATLELLQARRQPEEEVPASAVQLPTAYHDIWQLTSDATAQTLVIAAQIRRQFIPALFAGSRPLLIALGFFGVMYGLIVALVDPHLLDPKWDVISVPWLTTSGGSAFLITLVTMMILFFVARQHSLEGWTAFCKQVAVARAARERWQKVAATELKRRDKECRVWYAELSARRAEALRRAEERFEAEMEALKRTRDTGLAAAHRLYPPRLTQLSNEREKQIRTRTAESERRQTELSAQSQGALQVLDREHAERMRGFDSKREAAWETLVDRWHAALDEVLAQTESLTNASRANFPDWGDLLQDERSLPAEVPAAIAIGEYLVALGDIETDAPPEVQPTVDPGDFTVPLVVPFPDSRALVFKATDIGRAAAVQSMQAVMLRLLTALPPGKVRFTIIDPIGLGEYFSAFMHLADFDELLVSSRIWTEVSHIEQRLANLTEHMENVFQTYLRHDFQTIDEYNQSAGEVAEPYHILVVANFPANFSDTAARRLVSVVNSGARCGVYTVLMVDARQSMPHNFHLADIEQHATVLNWENGQWRMADPELSRLRLALEAPPPPEEFGRLVRRAGSLAQNARRVEVSFGRIAPAEAELWASDSRHGIDVPLGRAGATKLQHLRLGRGTSQHVLVAGKTGSGKSTFLHALITNLALHYGPDEIEFFLIDFKKGVEFKPYARHHLPHARVIAIESDREFGVSALERLDAILKERGELFRNAGAQDVAGYRQANPEARLPRILLIIDEFQEFFVEDDQLSGNAALLLDRLVRQGRAFGIHVLLGSQTLGGAYSLARSTLGQVAVRIALQCSETDAHLILSEDNTAARLLTRPGEAIYNDANGLLEGNHSFQIAWLPDDRRETYLDRIGELQNERGHAMSAPVIFEGNVAADPRQNHALQALLDTAADAVQPSRTETPAWLGEAVAIKDPTQVVFRSQSGSNLLLTGQSPDAALGILTTSLVSLAAAWRPAACRPTDGQPGARFIIVDGSPGGDSETVWQHLAAVLPGRVQLVENAGLATALAELTAEAARRDAAPGEPSSPIFLIIYHLARLRDLRKADDDFSFSGFDKNKPVSPGKLWNDLLRNGPLVGIHTLAWCDTFSNVSRWLSRDSLREFEMRVAFQMSGTDSSNFIDTPTAERLGPHRAILHLEDQGRNEKFRPYGPPTPEWLEAVGTALQGEVPEQEPPTVQESIEDLNTWTVT